MNKMILEGKWHQTKGAIREQWGKLTDKDVQMFLGEGEQLVGRLQERYGYTQERAEREVADFLDRLHEDQPLVAVREKTAEAVREHPWFARMFFGGILLLLTGYVVNRFLSVIENQEEVGERTG